MWSGMERLGLRPPGGTCVVDPQRVLQAVGQGATFLRKVWEIWRP
jgi:hypothetical protein